MKETRFSLFTLNEYERWKFNKIQTETRQDGGGFIQELLKASVIGGLKGLKNGRGVRDRIQKAKQGATRGAKQAVKRKTYEVLDRNIKRKFNDNFGD